MCATKTKSTGRARNLEGIARRIDTIDSFMPKIDLEARRGVGVFDVSADCTKLARLLTRKVLTAPAINAPLGSTRTGPVKVFAILPESGILFKPGDRPVPKS